MSDPPRDLGVNEQQRQRWNDERWTRSWLKREMLTGAVTGALMAALDLRAGERVLDVGTGGGPSAIEAARLVAPGGSVTGIDLSEALAALARQRAIDEGLGNVSVVVADAQTTRVPGAPFDVAMSQFGVMFFDDPPAAFANIRAQLRPGGRLAFACWQSAGANPWHPSAALRPFVAQPERPAATGRTAPGPFSLGDAAETTEILLAAGFAGVSHENTSVTIDGPASTLYDREQLAVQGVSNGQLDEAEAAVAEHLAQFRLVDGGYRFPMAYYIWSAVSP